MTPNSNYDLAFLHYFYETLRGYAEKLSDVETCAEKRNALEQEERRWRHVRGKLPALAVDERGVLMIGIPSPSFPCPGDSSPAAGEI